jgi:hypothetical protein
MTDLEKEFLELMKEAIKKVDDKQYRGELTAVEAADLKRMIENRMHAYKGDQHEFHPADEDATWPSDDNDGWDASEKCW